MRRTRLTFLTAMFACAVPGFAFAQGTTKTPTDSVAPHDSVGVPVMTQGPESSRQESFRIDGSDLMDKAKHVGNKGAERASELAQNNAVKGAAVGVACTVVPGASVASAVTHKGPCVASGPVGGGG